MVNLLPRSVVRALVFRYYTRLFTLGCAFIGCAFLISAAFLGPSFILATRAGEAAERYAQAAEESVGLKERSGVSESMRVLNERVSLLDAGSLYPQSTEIIEAMLKPLPRGVSVTAFAYATGEGAANVSVSGVAETRVALLAYAEALRASGQFEGVNVPVSQLALDADIPFSISGTFRTP